MAIKLRASKDYYLTEVTIEAPCDPRELDQVLRGLRTTGKTVIQYNEGGILGINVEQRTRIPEGLSAQVKELLGIREKIF